MTAIEAIGAPPTTFSVGTPFMPFPAAAVMVALPMPTPTANPLLDTVTMVESLLLQLKNWPAMGLPLMSFAMADDCADSPRAMLDAGRLRVPEATVTAAIPLVKCQPADRLLLGFAGGLASIADLPRQPRDSASRAFDGFALSSLLP